MISDISRSINHFIQAFSILSKPWAIKYVIASALISLITAIAFIFLAFHFGDNLGNMFYRLIPFESDLGWLNTIFGWISRILLWLSIIFLFKYIVIIITSPIMSVLSEKVEKHYSGHITTPVGISGQLKSIIRGSTLALTNVLKELLISVPVIVLSLIPGVVVFTTPFLFLIQSYFAGFGNFDFYLERHLNIRESKNFAKRNRIVLTANGAFFLMLLVIPIVGVLLAPAVGTISSTLSGIDLMDDHELI